VWIELSLAAGTFQTARNALARSLVGRVSPALNSWSRFAFNLPFSTTLVVAVALATRVPELTPGFFAFCTATAVTQLLANVALVSAFRHANFAESIVLHKLELVFTALVGVAFFNEAPTPLGWLGIVICGAGVLLINLGRSRGPEGWRRALHFDAGAILALACAVGLVAASFALKEANERFALANPWVGSGRFVAAANTLFHTTWIEVALLSTWLASHQRDQLPLVRVHWRRMLAIGATGFAGSLCWFWAYSLTLVAYVKAVGQIEAVLAVGLALFVWREPDVRQQLPGVLLIMLGIGAVLLG
jgi:drug/metabolite transporter (DMT)-like permease